MFSIDSSQNITVAQGDSFSFPFRVWADSSKTTLRDLSGYVIKLVACKQGTTANAPVGAVVLSLSTATGEITYNATTKVVTVGASPTKSTIALGTYPYAVEISNGTDVETLWIAEFTVIEDVA